jgi:hypothetical protein
MDYGAIGFFLGAIPGAVIVARSLWWQQKAQKQIVAAAFRNQDWKNTQLDIRQQKTLLTNPNGYIKPGDSAEVVEAKKKLINDLPDDWRRHRIGAFITFAGAFVGAFLGNLMN